MRVQNLFFVLICCSCMMSSSRLRADEKSPVISVTVENESKLFAKNRKLKDPLKITTADELQKAVEDETIRKSLADKVDLKTHTLLIFSWSGSGGDKMTFSVAESSPEQVTFSVILGKTRDLRPHVAIYAIRNDCKWSVK